MSKTEEKNSDWSTATLREVPFWREGMTPEEYDAEREYLGRNWDLFLKGEYVPLWKQNEQK